MGFQRNLLAQNVNFTEILGASRDVRIILGVSYTCLASYCFYTIVRVLYKVIFLSHDDWAPQQSKLTCLCRLPQPWFLHMMLIITTIRAVVHLVAVAASPSMDLWDDMLGVGFCCVCLMFSYSWAFSVIRVDLLGSHALKQCLIWVLIFLVIIIFSGIAVAISWKGKNNDEVVALIVSIVESIFLGLLLITFLILLFVTYRQHASSTPSASFTAYWTGSGGIGGENDGDGNRRRIDINGNIDRGNESIRGEMGGEMGGGIGGGIGTTGNNHYYNRFFPSRSIRKGKKLSRMNSWRVWKGVNNNNNSGEFDHTTTTTTTNSIWGSFSSTVSSPSSLSSVAVDGKRTKRVRRRALAIITLIICLFCFFIRLGLVIGVTTYYLIVGAFHPGSAMGISIDVFYYEIGEVFVAIVLIWAYNYWDLGIRKIPWHEALQFDDARNRMLNPRTVSINHTPGHDISISPSQRAVKADYDEWYEDEGETDITDFSKCNSFAASFGDNEESTQIRESKDDEKGKRKEEKDDIIISSLPPTPYYTDIPIHNTNNTNITTNINTMEERKNISIPLIDPSKGTFLRQYSTFTEEKDNYERDKDTNGDLKEDIKGRKEINMMGIIDNSIVLNEKEDVRKKEGRREVKKEEEEEESIYIDEKRVIGQGVSYLHSQLPIKMAPIQTDEEQLQKREIKKGRKEIGREEIGREEIGREELYIKGEEKEKERGRIGLEINGERRVVGIVGIKGRRTSSSSISSSPFTKKKEKTHHHTNRGNELWVEEEPLCSGGQGSVHKAYWWDTQYNEGPQRVLVKNRVVGEKLAELDELLLMRNAMKHMPPKTPVVKVLDFVYLKPVSRLLLVTEYCPLGDLSTYLKHNKVPPGLRLHFAHQIAKGLSYLHSKNIMHGDVKLSNIFLKSRRDGALLAKVGDFGLSVLLHSTEHVRGFRGTPSYMAPEVREGRTYDFAADVWSFGRVVTKLHLREVYALSELGPLTSRCLEIDPRTRPSFIEIEQKLGALLKREEAIRRGKREEGDNPSTLIASNSERGEGVDGIGEDRKMHILGLRTPQRSMSVPARQLHLLYHGLPFTPSPSTITPTPITNIIPTISTSSIIIGKEGEGKEENKGREKEEKDQIS